MKNNPIFIKIKAVFHYQILIILKKVLLKMKLKLEKQKILVQMLILIRSEIIIQKKIKKISLKWILMIIYFLEKY